MGQNLKKNEWNHGKTERGNGGKGGYLLEKINTIFVLR